MGKRRARHAYGIYAVLFSRERSRDRRQGSRIDLQVIFFWIWKQWSEQHAAYAGGEAEPAAQRIVEDQPCNHAFARIESVIAEQAGQIDVLVTIVSRPAGVDQCD